MDVEQRLMRLEKQNGKLRVFVGLAGVAIVLAIFMAADGRREPAGMRAMKSQGFILVDANGETRGGLYMHPTTGQPTLVLGGPQGETGFIAKLEEKGGASLQIGPMKKGTGAFNFIADKEDAVLMVFDNNATLRMITSTKNDLPIQIYDKEHEKQRAALGISNQTGDVKVGLWDQAGKMIWSAP